MKKVLRRQFFFQRYKSTCADLRYTLRVRYSPAASDVPADVSGFISYHVRRKPDISQFASANYITSRTSEIYHYFRIFWFMYWQLPQNMVLLPQINIYNSSFNFFRGISAVGSAQHWQCWGHGFESRMLHHIKKRIATETLFPKPAKIRKSVESCTSAWPFSSFEI